jgi:hypothetical protein
VATATTGPTIAGTAFQVTAALHGIGSAGDNKTPGSSSLSNKNPGHHQRPFTLEITNSDNQTVATLHGTLAYNASTGLFSGTVGAATLGQGAYSYRVTVPGLLTRRIPTFKTITLGQTNTLPTVTLVNGDIDEDKKVTILDYNLILQCFNATNCSTAPLADLNDDGPVNEFDYNLWFRELSVQPGDE